MSLYWRWTAAHVASHVPPGPRSRPCSLVTSHTHLPSAVTSSMRALYHSLPAPLRHYAPSPLLRPFATPPTPLRHSSYARSLHLRLFIPTTYALSPVASPPF
eukprot:2075075-Rhodomonas_salina.1